MDIRSRLTENSSGFTLIELIIVLAVMAVLAALSYPSLTTTLANNRVSDQGKNIQAILAFARSEAITRGETITITPSSDWQGITLVQAATTTIKSLPAFNSSTIITPATPLSFNSLGLASAVSISVSHADASVQSVLSIEAGGAISLVKNNCAAPCTSESEANSDTEPEAETDTEE